MRDRCGNPKNAAYAQYGGRGIRVCARWQQSFAAFFADIGPRPSADHSIDRRDNDGPYSPGNCRWATKEEQGNNQQKTIVVNIGGEGMGLRKACRKLSLPYARTYWRITQGGWSLYGALYS